MPKNQTFEEFAQGFGYDLKDLQGVNTPADKPQSFEAFAASMGYGDFPPPPAPSPPERTEIGKGLSRGILHTRALPHGAAAAIADVVGADDFAQRRVADYKRLTAEAEAIPAEVGSIEEIDSPGKFISWASSTLGEQLPNVAGFILSGGAGHLVTKSVAKHFIKKGITKNLATRGVDKFTVEAAEKLLQRKVQGWAQKGMLGGMYTFGAGLETGGIAGEQIDVGLELRGGVALVGGGIAGALELLPVMTVARQLGLGPQFQSKVLSSIKQLPLAKRILATGAIVSGQEAGTEAAQEVIAIAARDFVDENYDAISPEGRSRILNSAAAGGLVGFIFGGAGAGRRVQEVSPNKVSSQNAVEDSVSPSLQNVVKSPHQETYILGETGIEPLTNTDEVEIITDRFKASSEEIESSVNALSELVARLDAQPRKVEPLITPETSKETNLAFEGIILPSGAKLNKPLGKLVEQYNNTLQMFSIHRDAGAGKRLRALDRAIQQLSARKAIVIPPYLVPPETAAKAAVPTARDEALDIPASEILITEKREAPAVTKGLNPAQAKRLNQLMEKEQLKGLNEREYGVMEKLLAISQGEQVAEHEVVGDAKALEQLGKTVQAEESVRVKQDVKDEKNLLGISEVEVKGAVAEFLTKIKVRDGVKFYVTHSLDYVDSPHAEKASTSKGLYLIDSSGRAEIHLISDNIANKAQAMRTLLHELLAHHGLRAVLTPAQFNAMLRLIQHSKKIDLTSIREKYKKANPNMKLEDFEDLIAEEYIADIASSGTNMPLLNRIIAWIKSNLSKWFPKWSKDNISFSDEDIRYMLRDVQRYLRGRISGNNSGGIKAHVSRSGNVYSSIAASQADTLAEELGMDKDKEIAKAVNSLGGIWGVKFSKLMLSPLQISEKYGIKPVKDIVTEIQRWWATKSHFLSQADLLAQDWRKMGDHKAKKLSKALFEISTRSDEREERLSDQEVNELLVKEFHMDEEGMALYWRIDQNMKDVHTRLEKGLMHTAVRESLPGVDVESFMLSWNGAKTFEAKQKIVESAAPSGIADLNLLNRLIRIENDFHLMRNRNYFPRMRFGKYTVAVRAKKEGAVFDGKQYANDTLVVFETFESLAAAKKGLVALQESLGTTNFYFQESKISDQMFSFMGLPPSLMDTIKGELEMSIEQQEALKDIFIRMSPGRSFLKQLRARKGIEGYSEDAMRVYAAYTMSAANHLARVEHFSQIMAPLTEMQQWIKSARQSIPNNRTLVELTEYFEETVNYLMNPKNDWAQLRAVGFLWYLGMNPKSALVNASQVAMVTYPWLATHYGDAKSVAAIARSYKLVSQKWGGKTEQFSPEALRMFDQLLDEGVLDESQVMELAGIAEAPTLMRVMPQQRDTRVINHISYAAGWMFRHVEKYNRQVAAHAAFELKFDGMNYDEAYAFAKDTVQTTQYEYAKWNRPKFMRGKKSVIFLFKQYIQHTVFLMAGGRGKKMAARMWFMMFMVAGLTGVPFADDILDLIDWNATWVKELLGVKDPKTETREALREMLLNITDRPDIFMHGLGRYYGLGPMHVLSALGVPIPNVDISGSLSLGRITPGMAELDRENRNPDAKFGRVVMDILGPVGAMGYNIWKATESTDPDTWKRYERALPIAMKNVSKAYRWSQRGEETDRTGASLLEFDLSDPEDVSEMVLQGLGFTPTRSGQQYALRRSQQDAKMYWMARRSIILQNFAYAKLMGDERGVKDIRISQREYNRSIPHPMLRITGRDINQAIKNRRRNIQRADSGIPKQRRYRGLYAEKEELFPEVER